MVGGNVLLVFDQCLALNSKSIHLILPILVSVSVLGQYCCFHEVSESANVSHSTVYHVCCMEMASVCTSLFHRHNKCLEASSTMLVTTDKSHSSMLKFSL